MKSRVSKKIFHEVFGQGKIYLFGSRTDDNKRGGDIDLYLNPKNRENLYKKKIFFLFELDASIGEQKIDVVFAEDSNRSIEKTARQRRT